MSFTIPNAYVLQFEGNLRHLSQQMNARLRGCVDEQPITGEAAYIEQLAPTAAVKVTAIHADSPIMNSQHLRRRIAPYDYMWGDLIDRESKVRLLIDPDGGYSKAADMALRRGTDDEIIAAFFGTAYAGHTGSVALTWPNGNSETSPAQPAGTVVAVNDWTYGTGSGNAGLTVSKIISAAVALDGAEGDENEERYFAWSNKQKGNLLQTTEATSADYNSVRALVNGQLDTFMGFRFIRSQRLQVNGSGYRRCVAWRRSALGLGLAREISVRAGERPDKRFANYIYGDMSLGGARIEESGIVEVLCLES